MADYDLDPGFERGLEQLLRDISDEAVRPFDAVDITRAAAATAGGRWGLRLPKFANGWRAVLILGLLAASLIGVGIVGGFIKLTDNNINPNPSFQPFSPLPTTIASPAGPPGSPDSSVQASFVPATPSPSVALGTPSPSPESTATPAPTATPSPQPTASPSPTPQPSPTSSPTPQPVTGVFAVAQGDSHTCVLADDGRIFCMGYNDSGQLGDGSQVDYRNYPTEAVVGIDDAVAISAGIRFSCAIRAGGSVWCWGEDPGSDASSGVPFQVEGISDATSVTAGGAFACALRQGGAVACWGNNSLGQLGRGYFNGPDQPTPQNVIGIDNAIQISAGWNHACALRDDLTVWCWGGNGDGATGYGQLGDGTFDNSATPVHVTGLGDVVQVAAAGWSTCAQTAGEVWCWGYDERGTLGDGTFTNSNVPVQAVGIDDAELVVAGGFMACALRTDESVWCWGDTAWIGENNPPPGTPRQGNKSRPANVTALAADRFVVLVDPRGHVWGWPSGTNQTPERWPVGP